MRPKITYRFAGHFTPQDKTTSDYHYLPFDVPENVTRINVSYDFTRTGHIAHKAGYENVIDIGLFDPRGHEFNGPGFRGWSGSARAEFFVGLTEATPGYLPGPIPAGTWHIILGLYQIAPEGCDYSVTITLQSSQPKQPLSHSAKLSSQPARVVRTGAGWYRGDLHTHSHHSDAEASVAEIVNVARTRGLDFLAIMDHNTVSQLLELAAHSGPDLLLIPGMEVTTYYGHANVWGVRHWVDFRCRNAEDMRWVMDAAHAQEALFSINHPNPSTGERWEYGWIEGANAIEVWNGLWHNGDYLSLTWWDELLQAGRRIVAVGGSDQHQSQNFDPHSPRQVGIPTTWVYAQNLSIEAILAGIRAGHVFITADVHGPQVRLRVRTPNGQTAMMGDILELPAGTLVMVECEVDGAWGHVLELVRDGRVMSRHVLEDDSTRITWTVPVESAGYVRAQVIASGSGGQLPDPAYPRVLALTNAIYMKPKGKSDERSLL